MLRPVTHLTFLCYHYLQVHPDWYKDKMMLSLPRSVLFWLHLRADSALAWLSALSTAGVGLKSPCHELM